MYLRPWPLSGGRSDSLQVFHRPLVAHIAGIEGGLRLEQHYVSFRIRNRQVLHAAGHDDEFAGLDDLFMVAKAHAQFALEHQEEFVFVFMRMPDKLAFELNQLYVTIIQLARDARIPLILEQRELLREIYDLHKAPQVRKSRTLLL